MIKRIFMSGNGELVCMYSPISRFYGVVVGFGGYETNYAI